MSRDVQDQCFHESVHDKWCLRKGVWQTEVGLERGFVKHCLTPFKQLALCVSSKVREMIQSACTMGRMISLLVSSIPCKRLI